MRPQERPLAIRTPTSTPEIVANYGSVGGYWRFLCIGLFEFLIVIHNAAVDRGKKLLKGTVLVQLIEAIQLEGFEEEWSCAPVLLSAWSAVRRARDQLANTQRLECSCALDTTNRIDVTYRHRLLQSYDRQCLDGLIRERSLGPLRVCQFDSAGKLCLRFQPNAPRAPPHLHALIGRHKVRLELLQRFLDRWFVAAQSARQVLHSEGAVCTAQDRDHSRLKFPLLHCFPLSLARIS